MPISRAMNRSDRTIYRSIPGRNLARHSLYAFWLA